MLQFVIAGLVLGGIYAIASAGLVITYTSSGILNFAFGAMAYFIARLYYFLNTQHGWGIAPAVIASVVVAAPLMGVVLYVVLFRFLRLSSPLIKVVATIGLLVAIPSLATWIFGNQAIQEAPGLAPNPNAVYQFLGVPIDQNQIIVYICVVATVVLGAAVLRYTEVGLKVRAMVDSPAMTDLSGTSPTAISVGVWAVSTFFAGLAGVLTAPLNGLDPSQFTLLIAASFAAVVAARLRSLPVAVIVGLLMGVATSLIQRYLPSDSQWTTGLINAIPFIVIALFLVYSLFRGGRLGETEGWGGALDRAITPQGESRLAGSTSNVVETASLNFVGTLRRSAPAHHRRGGGAPPGERVLGRALPVGVRPGHHLPLLDDRHGRGRHALALPDHVRRRRRADHGPAGEPLRLAGPGRCRRGRSHRRRHGGDHRLPQHPAR